MKRILSYGFLLGVVFMAASAVAADMPKNGCTLQGSWMGTGSIKLLTTYNGLSASSGTIIEELPGFDMTLGGLFPTAVQGTTLRGTWQRTGGNTFVYTQVGYGLDAAGNIVWIGKNSGNKTLSDDCDVMTIESNLEVFLPEVNPFDGVAKYVLPVEPPIVLQRMRIDPPAPIGQ